MFRQIGETRNETVSSTAISLTPSGDTEAKLFSNRNGAVRIVNLGSNAIYVDMFLIPASTTISMPILPSQTEFFAWPENQHILSVVGTSGDRVAVTWGFDV